MTPSSLDRGVIEVEDRREAELEFGRLVGGVALEERRLRMPVWLTSVRPYWPKTLSSPGRAPPTGEAGGRHPRRLVERVADGAEAEEPILAEDRLVALERVGVVGIEEVLLAAERVEHAPAVGHRDEVVALRRHRRRHGVRIAELGRRHGGRRLAGNAALLGRRRLIGGRGLRDLDGGERDARRGCERLRVGARRGLGTCGARDKRRGRRQQQRPAQSFGSRPQHGQPPRPRVRGMRSLPAR